MTRGSYIRLETALTTLGLVLLLGACASGPPFSPLVVYDKLPAGADKGYLELYCTDCLSSYSVSLVEGDKENTITSFALGKSVAAAAKQTGRDRRLKRLRIAQPPGTEAYKVASASPAFDGLPQRFTAVTAKDHLTPIRVEFIRYTDVSLDWKVVVGPPIPLSADPSSTESLMSALSAPDWGTRWYAVEALIMRGEKLPGDGVLAQRVQELSTQDAYNECLAHENVFECALVREQAAQAVKAIVAQSP